MSNPARVFLRIISAKGTCLANHKEGQEFDLSQEFTLGHRSTNPKTLCAAGFYAVYPTWRVLRYGGELPWEEDKDRVKIACPDPFNPVVMELRRVKE